MRWEYEAYQWIAAGFLAFAVLCFAVGHVMRRRATQHAGDPLQVKTLLRTFSLERRLFKQLLVVLAVALLALAALRPQYGRSPEPLRQTGIDIAIAFDISKSMRARDILPSRLQSARFELAALLDSLHGHRTALVPFAGIAFPQSPLTADKSAIRLYLQSLDPAQMPVGGTNLAAAITEGTRLLTGEKDKGDKQSRSRVLLLITDGEDVSPDQGEGAREAAKAAAEQGIAIFAVAVGTRLGEPIPILNADGTHAGYQVDSDDKPIYSKMNSAFLEELCSLSAGYTQGQKRVYELTQNSSVAPELTQAFDQMQKTALEQSLRHRHGEKFQFFLIPALLLLAFELPLSERKRVKEAKS